MIETNPNTVGGRIRKVRKIAKLTMSAFAQRISVTANYIGLIERGQRNPSPELLYRISFAMGVPYKWLIDGGELPPLPKANNETKTHHGTPESDWLITVFNKLNPLGQAEAIKRIEELAQLPIYAVTSQTTSQKE